jgi:hypothetical protein
LRARGGLLGRAHTDGDVMPKEQLAFFRGYLGDLIAAVKGAAASSVL